MSAEEYQNPSTNKESIKLIESVINEENEIVAHEVSQDTMSHLKDLMPMIKKMLKRCLKYSKARQNIKNRL